MRHSFVTFLLAPSLLVVAWLTSVAMSQPFAGIAVLLCGGALTAGFITSMQDHYVQPAAQEQPVIARGVALVFRFGIGLPVIVCMIYAAMHAMAVV